MNDRWKRWVLYFAGIWNIAGGVNALADPPAHFAGLYNGSLALDDPLQAFFFRATWINVIAWGFGYVLAGHWSQGRLPILLAGAAGKLAYFGACWALYASGKGGSVLFAVGALDVIFAAIFMYIVWTRREAA